MTHKCPQCHSERVTSDRIVFDGADRVVVPMSCDGCGYYWTAIFVFKDYELPAVAYPEETT